MPARVARALSDLFDRKVTTSKAPAPLAAASVVALGTYTGDANELRVVLACDAAIAAYAGAALALLPVNEAEAARKANAIPTRLSENLREVLNVLTPALNAELGRRVHFRGIAAVDARAAALAALAKSAARADFVLAIAGYGSGTMAIARVG